MDEAPVPTARLRAADLELAAALRISVMRLARRLRAERADLTLSLNQLAVLGTLAKSGPLTPRDLAAAERVQPPSMTRILAALEERGLVTRAPHPVDRRQVLVTLTPAAERMVREDRRRREAWLARRLAEISPEDRAALRAAAGVLERLAGS